MSLPFKIKKFSAGFTMIEMLVVVGIFLIVTGVVLGNFRGFARKSSIDLLAREMSLVIRQAQVYGSATRRYEGDVNPSQSKFPSYGVYLAGNGVGSFQLFADKDADGLMDGGHDSCDTTGECVEQFNLTGGALIDQVKGCWGGSDSDCEDVKKSSGDEWLNLLFRRPQLGAVFNVKCDADNCPDHCSDDGDLARCAYDYVKIIIKDPASNEERDLRVWNTGHIYVESELN